MKIRVVTITNILFLFFVIYLFGCNTRKEDIVGHWQWHVTPVIVGDIEYKNNGTLAVIYNTPSGKIGATGIYELKGDTLSQTYTRLLCNTSSGHIQLNAPITGRYNVSGATLVIQPAEGGPVTFTRVR